MSIARRTALTIVALGAIASPMYFAFAQPGSTPPAPAPANSAPSSQPAPTTPPAPPDRERGEGNRRPDQGATPATINQAMKLMNRSLGRLNKQLADATKKDENLKLVSEFQRGCVAAKAMDPKPGLEHAKPTVKPEEVAAAYRHRLMAVMSKSLELEAAVLDDKTDAAKALIKDLIKLRDEGHTAMGVEKD